MNCEEKPLAASTRRITAAGGVNQSVKKAAERRKGLFHTCNSLAPLVGLVVISSSNRGIVALRNAKTRAKLSLIAGLRPGIGCRRGLARSIKFEVNCVFRLNATFRRAC